ncbi:regulatory protein, luxR family [Paractinoplanes atraurantiacus]|uniref:Regulatory protein, luxR family n=2 Tax=Paractinoplanes atraurantiacus TaxID=1036182 RepID=A0A285KU11_9ACTN|nr:regulatory protein, luxR family [Actinoplanes atraurantiacus]
MLVNTAGRELRGRQREQQELDRVLREVRDGRSRALVLRGEAGTGKTALLRHLGGEAGRDGDLRVLRTAGVESESEIAYSALQQLCAPLIGELDRLPAPQRAALSVAFGLSAGETPELLILGMATLGLLSAHGRPVVCLVDDVQWLDRLSGLILAFVARRLKDESVALVFAVRDPAPEPILTDLPEIRVEGLPEAEAGALLDSVLTGPVDARVRDRILAETRGNPLALLELTKGLSAAELAFGFGGCGVASLESRVEAGFRQRIAALPGPARMALIAAAVEPVGDVLLLRRALETLGLSPEAAAPAEIDGLIEIGTAVRFSHPLVRSAAWRSADVASLREVHRALAEATDGERDPDRRAWHRAHATAGPDQEVAAELEKSAGRALARGGRSAAAAFLERAAELTRDQQRRGALLVSAAGTRAHAGSYAQVPDLLAAAEIGPLSDLDRARVERLRAQVAFAVTHGRESGPALLAAAVRLRSLDPVAARDTFLSAIGAALYAGRLGGDDLRRAALAARDALVGADRRDPLPAGPDFRGPLPAGLDFRDLLLAGLTTWILDGRDRALPLLARALDAMTEPEDLSLIWLTSPVAHELHRMDDAYRMSERAVAFARDTGALSLLPTAFALQARSLVYAGRFADAARLLDELDAAVRLTGGAVMQPTHLVLAAYRGRERPALDLIEEQLRDAAAWNDGRRHTMAAHAKAVLHNGLGNHKAALAAAQESAAYPDLGLHQWPLLELVEAAVHTGDQPIAVSACASLRERTATVDTAWSRGMQALADGLAAADEQSFRVAIEELSAPETTLEAHRARLLFGEWLRRAGRRAEARLHLRTAYEAFTEMGAEGFAERACRELAACGGNTIVRTVADPRTTEKLTPQESAIAAMAVQGRTNGEIAGSMFLSPRTVEWHLRKIYAKLGIASRRELTSALS